MFKSKVLKQYQLQDILGWMKILFANLSLNQNKKVWWSNIDFEFFIKLFCESLGGYLLEIQDQEENEWITQKMLKTGNVMTT